MITPPPLPSPPLPPKSSRWKLPLIVIGSIFGILLLLIGFGFFFVFTAREFEPTPSQKETVVTIDYAAEFFEIDRTFGVEEWSCEKYIDGSIQIYYLYVDETTTLDCTITVELNRGDARASYLGEWQGLKIFNNFGEADASLEPADAVFSWGDDSKFAFQVADDERYGFAFITRIGNKVFFIDAWGIVIEEPEEISAFLTPKLELFQAESYLK